MALILNARSSLARVIFISAMANLEKRKENNLHAQFLYVIDCGVFLARKYDYFLSFGLWTAPHADADPGASAECYKSVFDKKYLLG